MAAIRVLAIRRGRAPELAYFEQGPPNPNLVRLRRSLRKFVRQRGEPHHFKMHVVVGNVPTQPPVCYGPMGTALPPSVERNGLSLFASLPLSRQQDRHSAFAFATSRAGQAQQVIISPAGHVDSHPMVVDPTR